MAQSGFSLEISISNSSSVCIMLIFIFSMRSLNKSELLSGQTVEKCWVLVKDFSWKTVKEPTWIVNSWLSQLSLKYMVASKIIFWCTGALKCLLNKRCKWSARIWSDFITNIGNLQVEGLLIKPGLHSLSKTSVSSYSLFLT